MADGCADCRDPCGGQGYASKKRSHSQKLTLITGVAHCSCAAAREGVAAKSAWTHGGGTSRSRGSSCVSVFRWARCSVCLTAGRAVASGRPPPPDLSYAGQPPQPVSGGGSLHISYDTLMRVEMAREGVTLVVIQRRLGDSNLGITSVYLQGIDNAEIIDTVHTRRAPMIPVSTSLRL